MNSTSVLNRKARPPDLVLRYGPEDDHVADVHLPAPSSETAAGPAPRVAPLVVFLHGGFWRAKYGREHTAPLAEALAAAGFIACAPEYRRTGQRGGGWPGTFDDVAAAVDRLPGLVAAASGAAAELPLVLAGHSAGGHLALWAASRHRLPAGTPWQLPAQHSVRTAQHSARAVVALAAVSDLAACERLRLGRGAAAALIGGRPRKFPDRYLAADPARLLPAAAPVWLLHGESDDVVPAGMSLDYVPRARAAGGVADCLVLARTGHFALIDPLSAAWPHVLAAFRSAADAGV